MAQQTYGEWMRSNPQIPNLTAVEWLLKQINKQSYSLGDINITINVPKDIIEQAKQMEKEQIVKTYNDAINKMDYFIQPESAEQYYNETYKK